MSTHFIVLGGGLVGGFIARTLALDGSAQVTLADRDQNVLEQSATLAPLSYNVANLSDADVLRSVIQLADVVIGALPGRLGFNALQTVLGAGKPCIDISFFPEDALQLNTLAREHGALAVVDCGVMPGLGGMLAYDLARRLDVPRRMRILVGGLPVERVWPYEYRAPFSPSDVIEEYMRPARIKLNGQIVEREALSEPELIDFHSIGTLEAFNTDGLRTLLGTLPYPTMIEKTLRYPGHIEKMRMLRESGFFSEVALNIKGHAVRPIDVSSQLLFNAWKLLPGMREFTVMRVEAEGLQDGIEVMLRYDLLDYTDALTGDFSMARTTGWPAVLAARMYAAGQLRGFGPGVVPAEKLAADPGVFEAMLTGLRKAGISLHFEAEALG